MATSHKKGTISGAIEQASGAPIRRTIVYGERAVPFGVGLHVGWAYRERWADCEIYTATNGDVQLTGSSLWNRGLYVRERRK